MPQGDMIEQDDMDDDEDFDPDDMFDRDDEPFFGRGGEKGPFMTRDEAEESRFFIATAGADGEIQQVNVERISSVDEAEARSYAKEALSSGKDEGFVGEFRYSVENDGPGMRITFLDCGRVLESFRDFLRYSILMSLAGLAVMFGVITFFAGRIVRPVAESYEKQKRFITDAGHELKTPITIIQADADVLESEMTEESEWIEDIRRQTRRLSELTADMIFLSRMEEENAALQMQDFSLSELVEETARSFQALVRSRNKSFRASVAPELRMTGDEKAVARLVSILMDNAMKYSPEGGSVELTLDKDGRNGRLVVKNTSLPMEKGSADHLLERFARGDSSRNSESGGFGLGLSIARAVTEAHRGKIHAQSEDGESLTVTVELPLS